MNQPLLEGTPNDIDVLIVGAGPVGVLSAIELSSRGCKVRIVDDNDEPVIKTKASGIVGRSLEVLPSSVVDKVLANACHVKHGKIYETDRKGTRSVLADLDFTGVARAHRYQGMRSQQQWATEKFLMEHLHTLPDCNGKPGSLRVERSVRLVDFSETANGVECDVDKGGVKERIVAKFLLGCDGGSSLVRKKLGFSFAGEVTAEYFFALHCGLENYAGDPTELAICCSQEASDLGVGFAFAMPMPDGGYLMTLDLDEAQQREWMTDEKDRHGLAVLRQPSAEDVCHVLSARGFGANLAPKPGTVKWIAHFRVNSRQAEHYGSGRVYLAGDACHCHSPLGGQGMNMGFQDAKNIAWKLGFAAKGALPMSVLPTYEAERHGIEKKICHAIEVGQKVMSTRNPVAMFIRGRGQRIGPMLAQMTGNDKEMQTFGMQHAWSYHTSALTMEHWERPFITPASICPGGGFRRRQNTFRWIGTRTRAGDSMPEAPTEDGGSIQDVIKEGRGWALLLFEGTPEGNAENERFIAAPLPLAELRAFGESMRMSQSLLGETRGFVSGIDTVIVLPFSKCEEAHNVFGVRGQCLMLVRPDFHVGLRSEPIRAGVVYRYFKDACGMPSPPVKKDVAPKSAPYKDMFPVMVWGMVTMGFGVWLAASWATSSDQPASQFAGKHKVAIGGFVVSFLVNCFIFKISQPPH